MNDIIIKIPKVPEPRYRKCKRRLNNKKPPKLKIPGLKTSPSLVIRGTLAGLISDVTNINNIKKQRIGAKETEKPVIGAGRGGKHYSKNVSHYGRF